MPTNYRERVVTLPTYRGLFKDGSRHRKLIAFPLLFGPAVLQYATGIDGLGAGGFAAAFLSAAYHHGAERNMQSQGVPAAQGSVKIVKTQSMIYAAVVFASVAGHAWWNKPAAPAVPRPAQLASLMIR